MTVHEGFDHPAPYEWSLQGNTYIATFRVGDIDYWVNTYPTKAKLPPTYETRTVWIFNFGIGKETAGKLHGDVHAIMKPTGLGRPFSVLSTVRAALDDFISHHHPEAIWFSDTDGIASRQRLYQKFAEYLVSTYDYRFDQAVMHHFAAEAQRGKVWFLRRAETFDGWHARRIRRVQSGESDDH